MPNISRNCLAAVALRYSITTVFTFSVFASGIFAQPAPPAKPISITGVYNGSYAGDQGPTKFKLSVTQQDTGTLTGSFTLSLPDGSDTKEYTCPVSGRFIAANRMVQLVRVGKWETVPPSGIQVVGLNGVFDPGGGNGAGQISGMMRARPGPKFEAIRDPDESAQMASAAAAKKAAGAPAPPATPPAPVLVAAAPQNSQPAAPKAAALPPPSSPASPTNAASPTAINGVYTGEFQRTEGNSKLKFSIKAADDGSFTALFTFDPPPRKRGSSATYRLTGRYDPKAHDQWGNKIEPFQITTIEPMGSAAQAVLDASKAQAGRLTLATPGLVTGLLSRIDPKSGESYVGRFTVNKDRAQPADLDQAMLSQAGAATAPPAPIARLPLEGVYNGTYASKDAPATKFKLMLWLDHQGVTAAGKVIRTDIGALLAVFPSDDSGTLPCVCELKGFYGDTSRVVQLTSHGWEPRMASIPLMTGLEGKFDPAGGAGGGQISGAMTEPGSPTFQAMKDAAESASMNVERLRNRVYPCIIGVFNGTYTRANELPAKFKLTVKHNGDGPAGLAGLATIYLPSDSGIKPYTYDLKGVETSHGQFQLLVHDWVSTPPSDFKNFKAMGFNGKIIVNDAVTTAKMSSLPPSPLMAEFCLPQFEATWDTTESADIDAAIAAQKAIGSAEEATAMKARDQTLKNAPPKELASKDLVRKSRQYWDGYDNDMIREIFDGGFGAAMDENELFQKVFVTYVETFSKKCPECLPANHQAVTVTVITSLTVTKNLSWREGVDPEADRYQTNKTEQTFTVNMDPRFVDRYEQFQAALNSPGAGLRTAIAAAQPGGTQAVVSNLVAIVTDMQKFFADHPGKSAAMQQLNENFLRAINGDPSLQQAGGKIDGAAAESDKDVLPGRYARFVDGANAYFIERANSNPTKFGHSESHDTQLCQRLAELYDRDMTREEEYYYANDFAGRFIPIMGQRASCPDPAWPQLHPDVEKAVAAVK